MILVSNPDKPLILNPKGNVRAPETLVEYEEEIKDAYDSFANASFAKAPQSEVLQQDKGKLVKDIVIDVMGEGIDPDKDIFQQGCDR